RQEVGGRLRTRVVRAPVRARPTGFASYKCDQTGDREVAVAHDRKAAARSSSVPYLFSTGLVLVVLVVATPPVARLIAPPGSAVEPLPHAPEAVQSARIGRIGMVDDGVLENEGAHSRPFAEIRWPIDSSPPYVLGGRASPAGWLPGVLASVVVFDASVVLLLITTE